jgi:hypothetical protein
MRGNIMSADAAPAEMLRAVVDGVDGLLETP